MVYFSLRDMRLRGTHMDYISHNEEETEAIGEALAVRLLPGAVIACRGGLGAGKTAFTRGLARGLGYEGRVTSPTFTIVNEYEGKIPLFHFDMYRLGDEDGLFDIGWGGLPEPWRRVCRGVERAHRRGAAPGDHQSDHFPLSGK